jgi:hypothetical protein
VKYLVLACLFACAGAVAFGQTPPVINYPYAPSVTDGRKAFLELSARSPNGAPVTWRLQVGSRSFPVTSTVSFFPSGFIPGTDTHMTWGEAGPFTLADNGLPLTFFATNIYGTSSFAGGALSVTPVAPYFSLSPVGRAAALGSDVTFTARAAGSGDSFQYQWRKNGTSIAGATGTTYILRNITANDAGSYDVVATNTYGTATSNSAALTTFTSPLAVVQQPSSQSVALGGTVAFTAGFNGSPPITYQWLKDAKPIAGATTTTLTLANVQASDTGNYQLAATNPSGQVLTSPAVLSLTTSPLSFTRQPQPISARTGTSATFEATVAGTGPITYQWRKDAVAIAGATSAALTLPAVDSSHAGSYSVVATNSVGSITSDAALLTVTSPPVFAQSLPNQTALLGGTVSFQANASGTGPLGYQWQKDGTPIAGATNANLTLVDVRAADAGAYSVVVTNPIGNASSNEATLAVDLPGQLINLSLLTSLQGSGDSFKLGVVLGGAGAVGTTPLLVRAVGPSLSQFGVTTALSDPKLELFSGATKTGENDDWAGVPAVVQATAQAGAFPLTSASSKDAAHFAAALPTGDNSITISGNGNSSGMVLAEVYDVTARGALTSTTPRIVNVSVLKSIEGSLTAGFVIRGTTEVNVLIRAIGPSLASFGVTGFVPDPRLELKKGSSSVSANDDWGSTPGLAAAFEKVGAFLLAAGSKDAALLATLAPGDYTVQVTGAGAATGLALVEIYEVR